MSRETIGKTPCYPRSGQSAASQKQVQNAVDRKREPNELDEQKAPPVGCGVGSPESKCSRCFRCIQCRFHDSCKGGCYNCRGCVKCRNGGLEPHLRRWPQTARKTDRQTGKEKVKGTWAKAPVGAEAACPKHVKPLADGRERFCTII